MDILPSSNRKGKNIIELKVKEKKEWKRGISHVAGMNSREVKINIGYVFETSGGWTFPFLFLLTSHHYLLLDSQSAKRVSQNQGI